MSAIHRYLSTVVLCLVALSPSASVAALIDPVSQTRTVTAATTHPFGTPSSSSMSAPDFGPFDGYASARSGSGDYAEASVRQISTIGTDHIDLSVNGLTLFGTFGGTATASSLFDVTFDLLVESDYELFHQGTQNQFVSANGTLSDSGGVIATLYANTYFSGTLSPGRYRLQLSAAGSGAFDYFDGSIYQNMNLAFTAVPEPATAWLVASGLLVLAATRKR